MLLPLEEAIGDDAIALPPLRAGARRYAVTNTGTRPHELFILGVHNPDDFGQADAWTAWLESGQVGPAPIDAHLPGGHQTIDPGVTVWLTLALHPATSYAFVDPAGGSGIPVIATTP